MSEVKDRKSIVETAAEHHARVASGSMTAEDWQALERWIAESPEHREVFDSMGRMADGLRSLGDDSLAFDTGTAETGLERTSEEGAEQPRVVSIARRTPSWRRPRYLAMAAAVLAAILVPYLFSPQGPGVTESAVYASETGERRTVVLGDGSSMALNARSRVSAAFTVSERKLSLLEGEVFLEVVPDGEKPFRVVAGPNVVTVVGTAFDLVYRNHASRLTVYEGTVEVTPAATRGGAGRRDTVAGPVRVKQGEQLALERGSIPVPLDEDELLARAAWRDGWLHFDDRSLSELVRELAPYSDRPIVVTSQSAADLKVGGSFNVDRLDTVLTALESLLPVHVRQEDDRILIDYAGEETG